MLTTTSGLHEFWGSELGSSYMQGKHFTHQAIPIGLHWDLLLNVSLFMCVFFFFKKNIIIVSDAHSIQ